MITVIRMKRIAVVLSASTTKSELVHEAIAVLKDARIPFQIFVAENLSELSEPEFDGLVFPGDTPTMPEAARSIRQFHKASKPIACIGLATHIVADALTSETLTIAGEKENKVGEIYFETCAADDFITDREHKIISTAPQPTEQGVQLALAELIEMA